MIADRCGNALSTNAAAAAAYVAGVDALFAALSTEIARQLTSTRADS